MTRIRCNYEECVFLKKGLCSAHVIDLDPEDGCLTYSEDPSDLVRKDVILDDNGDDVYEDDWEDVGFEELDEMEELDFDEDEF